MSLDVPIPEPIDGRDFRFAVVAASYNQRLVNALVERAVSTLETAGSATPCVERVPGSAELPYAASLIAANGGFDAVIVIGVVIAGDTSHHQIIGDSTASALQNLSLQSHVPIINGILVVENQQQAEARVGDSINRGREFAEAALAMAQFRKKWKQTKTNP
ncbi:MAG: 6,7-dimethyl-8-ribityllumazine synthase [Opitutales bacterium]